MGKVETKSSNVFDLENPDQWVCKLSDYTEKHLHLQVRIEHPDRKTLRYLNFLDVAYIDCPTFWTGANFEIADSKECLELLRSTDSFGTVSDASLQKDYVLFVADIVNTSGKDVQVRIIAAPISGLSEDDLFDPKTFANRK